MASSSLAPLYTHLGLDPDGGPYDSTTLKKAFFKMSKIHHPDKNGGDASRFHSIKESYEILRDPHKKAAFEARGKEGVQEQEGMGDNPRAQLAAALLLLEKCGKLFAGLMCLLTIFTVALIMLGTSFACLRADQALYTKNWTWGATLIPLWILEVALGIGAIVMSLRTNPCLPTRNRAAESSSARARQRIQCQNVQHWIVRSCHLVAFATFVVCQVLVAIKLDGGFGAGVTWVQVLVPSSMVFFVLLLVADLLVSVIEICEVVESNGGEDVGVANERNPLLPTVRIDTSGADKSPRKYCCVVTMALLRALSRVVCLGLLATQVVLVALRVDGTIKSSWWLLFVPLWVELGRQTILATISCLMGRATNLQSMSDEENQPFRTDDTVDSGASTPSRADRATFDEHLDRERKLRLLRQKHASSSHCCAGFLMCCLAGIGALLLAAKIELQNMSACAVASPLFIIGIFICLGGCCLGCTVCCFSFVSKIIIQSNRQSEEGSGSQL